MKNKKPIKDSSPVVYTDEQDKKIEEHIEKYFGKIESVFQEKDSTDIKMKIFVIPPQKKKPFYTLVTSGFGAFLMNIPDDLKSEKLERAELILCLPPGWKFNNDDMDNYWPVHLLSLLSRLPMEENTWLGWGHTIDYETPFSENCNFSGAILIFSVFDDDSRICKFSDDDEVNFYQVLPLYPCEIEFKKINGAGSLLSKFNNDYPFIADIDRKPCVDENFMNIIDSVEDHASKVEEKELDIPDISGANHIAAFFLWALDNDLVSDDFIDYFDEEIEQIRSGEYDVRKFIINSLDGELTMDMFTDEGQSFAQYYYDFYHSDDEPCYPGDVDKMALDYFGEERYNSDEFSDEAYLFVPFDENYHKAMRKYIEENYKKFKNIK